MSSWNHVAFVISSRCPRNGFSNCHRKPLTRQVICGRLSECQAFGTGKKGYLDIYRLLNIVVLPLFPPLALAFALELFQSANSSHFRGVSCHFEVLKSSLPLPASLSHSFAPSLFCSESSVSFTVCPPVFANLSLCGVKNI